MAATIAVAAVPASAQSTAEFYSKHGLKILIGTAVGGSYDLMGRLTGRHLARHIPGKPSVLYQNMPGGGSLLATNHIYNVAPQDGSVLGAVVPGIILSALFKEKSVRYDPRKLQWVGNAMDAIPVPVLYHTAPVKTLADLKTKGAIMGAGGISSMDATNAFLMNELLGTKIQVVQGYKGGDAMNLAMERGEIYGRASSAWVGWRAIRPDWIRDGKLIPLVQFGFEPIDDPNLKNVPLLTDLIKDDGDRKIARAYLTLAVLGRPTVMGPNVPKDRVESVRAAYKAMVADPAFLADAKKQRIDIKPITGEKIQDMVAEMWGLDAKLSDRMRSIVRKKKPKKKK
ncbi:MAG: Bug family tripartite tricarboxylate transporter substrate binding protein [Alphaproteobacteria bacterium]